MKDRTAGMDPKQEGYQENAASLEEGSSPGGAKTKENALTKVDSAATEAGQAELPSSEEKSTTSGPSLQERVGALFSPSGEQTAAVPGGVRRWLATGSWIYILIAALLIAALLLPPISLLRRVGLTGYTRLNADNPAASHADGLTVRIDPEETPRLRVALGSVPMVDFLEGAAGNGLRTAVESTPEVLQVKSPYYQIRTGSRTRGPATIEIVIPNNAEPWETLDLYAWDGEAWQWLGGTLDAEQELLTARVAQLPASVVVMQTSAVVPAVGTIADAPPSGPAAEVLTEVLLPGLYLGSEGTFLGQVPAIAEGENPEPLLLIGNAQEEQAPALGLLSEMLSDPELRQTHVENAVTVAEAAGANGIALDYQGVSAEQREAFSAFVAALEEELHETDVRLEVLVPAPAQTEDGWDSGGYDWAALGTAADALLVPLPADPAAYAGGGGADALLRWAVGQVSRYKLRAVVSSLSCDHNAAGIEHVTLAEALAPFGEVHTSAEEKLEPGQQATFTLAGQVSSIVREEQAGTYTIAYRDEGGNACNVWLGTPSFLAHRLNWALRYHLGGVMIRNLTTEGNFPGVLEAVAGYRTAAALAEPTELEITWTVSGPEGASSEEKVALTQPDFRWTAPETAGEYIVSAAIAGVSRGSVPVQVAAAEPEPVTVTLTAEEAACLQASFVSDVTVPDGTQFDNGEAFVKTWRLRNSGTCEWPAGTVLAFTGGSQMDGPDSVALEEAVPSGESVDISVDLVAPEEAGKYTGNWSLKAGDKDVPGGAVVVIIQAGEVQAAAAAPAAPGPITPVASGSFELGGHVRDTSLPYADLMHYAGMNWTKVQVHFGQDASGLIATSHAKGFKIQLSALGGAGMVTEAGFEDNYANWVAQLAAAGADAIEVWNEPNIDREWQIGHISPQAYTSLLCKAYQAIKAANPNTAVISAAPSPTGYFGGCSPNGCDDKPWMEGIYAAGAANCMDYIGAHHNAGATSPSARIGHPANPGDPHHSWFFLPQTELYYNIFRGTRKLFYTEMGYCSQEGVPTFSDQFAWGRGTDNAEQAAWLAEAVQLSVNTGMVRCIIVWNIDFVRYGYDPQDGYAIIRPGGSCPACDTLHAVLGTR